MDHTPAATRQARIAPWEHEVFTIAALPDDVLPNIFSRLPASQIFGLSTVSTRFLHCSRPAVRDWALGELNATLDLHGETRWQRLLDVMRNGLHRIDPAFWNAWMQAAKSRGQTCVLAQMARLAPSIIGEARSAELAASAAPLPLNQHAHYELQSLALWSKGNPWMGEAAVAIIAGAMCHLIRKENDSADAKVLFMNTTLDWIRVVECIPKLSLAHQIRVLSQVAPAARDEDQVGHGLDLPWRTHVDAMWKGLRTPWPADVQQARRTATYFRMLQRQARHPGEDRRLAMDRLLCAWFSPAFRTAPWREQPPELSECLLIAIANGPKRNDFNEVLCARMVASGFITGAEMVAFTNHVFNRCEGIDPVREWMLDNRDRVVKTTACTLS
jgi:hypothetical protein